MSQSTIRIVINGVHHLVTWPAVSRLHQAPGFIMHPDRHYIFNRERGGQIIDQPCNGFSSRDEAYLWLANHIMEMCFPLGDSGYSATDVVAILKKLIVAPAWAAVDTLGKPVKRP